jgi:hypothetical protein
VPWFRVDDSFYDHPKVFDASDSAVALWTRAGSWSARNLTNGYVPAAMLARFCSDPETAAGELVRRRLWSRSRGGYQFHDWDHYQPMKEAVENERKAARERMRKLRKARSDPETFGRTSGEVQAKFGRSSPAPTQPSPSTSTGSYQRAGPSYPQARKTGFETNPLNGAAARAPSARTLAQAEAEALHRENP